MNKKLNYIFGQVLDNYKTAYKENSGLYIGLGIFFLFLSGGAIFTLSFLGFVLYDNTDINYIQAIYIYIYLLVLGLPCLALLKEKKQDMKFWETFRQNIGTVLVLSLLTVVGFGFITLYETFSKNLGLPYFLNGLFGISGNVLTIVILLLMLRVLTQKRIPISQLLLEALVLTIVLCPLIQEALDFLTYGLFQSISGGGMLDEFGRVIGMLFFFLLVNMFLGPLLVLIITSMVGYEEPAVLSAETTSTEVL